MFYCLAIPVIVGMRVVLIVVVVVDVVVLSTCGNLFVIVGVVN